MQCVAGCQNRQVPNKLATLRSTNKAYMTEHDSAATGALRDVAAVKFHQVSMATDVK